MLNQLVKRFDILYPKLRQRSFEIAVKDQARSKDDLSKKVQDIQLADKQDHPHFTQEQVKLISNLAKTEILTIVDDSQATPELGRESDLASANTLKQELLLKIQEINNQQMADIESQTIVLNRNVFVLFMMVQLSKRIEGERDNLFHLYKMFQGNTLKYINYHISRPATALDGTNEPNLSQNQLIDFDIKEIESMDKDPVIQQNLVIISYLQKHIVKTGGQLMVQTIFDDLIQCLRELLQMYGIDGQNIQDAKALPTLNKMLPFAFLYKTLINLLEETNFNKSILGSLLQAGEASQLGAPQALQHIVVKAREIYELSQVLTTIFKKQSRFYLTNHAADSNWKKSKAGNKETKRSGGLFSHIQDMLIQFNCVYFRKFFGIIDQHVLLQQCEALFKIIFVDDDDDGVENFLLQERLSIMGQLNDIFNLAPSIIQDPIYWTYIRRGTYDWDAYCRKLAISILQQNINKLQNMDQFCEELAVIYQAFNLNKQKFEMLWSTFFDVYDTLDAFSSHLTKAIWERTETFYSFLRDNCHQWQQSAKIHPLIDFKEWLLCLSVRALTHENTNIRKYVQKELLARKYVTPLSADFIFGKFLQVLNEGLILKDSNAYTQFSRNNVLIIDFYSNYLRSESMDIERDLHLLLKGMMNNVDNPQMVVSLFKVLASPFQKQDGQPVAFIGPDELQQVTEYTKRFRWDLIFSNRYLCYKYILQMVTRYIKITDLLSKGTQQSNLLVLLGQMPFELFSASDSIIYTDKEGLETASFFVDKLGADNLQGIMQAYLTDIFQVKASLQAIPKFQGIGALTGVLQGIVRVLLILDTKFEDQNVVWFQQMMQENLSIFYGQVLSSSYLSSDVIDQKIECFTHIFNDLLKFSSTQRFRDLLVHQVKMGAHLILDRIEHSLLVPLSLYGGGPDLKTQTVEFSSGQKVIQGFQDRTKMQSGFKMLTMYCDYLQMAVRSFHIYQCVNSFDQNNPSSDSAIEKMMKLILSHALKLSQQVPDTITQKTRNIFNNEQGAQTTNLGVLLWQHAALEILHAVLQAYSSGIKENLKRSIDNLLVPDAVFTIGKSICMNFVNFEPVRYNHRANESEKVALSQDQYQFLEQILIDMEWTTKQLQVQANFGYWAVLGELINLFQFDQQLREEMMVVMYPEIGKKAIENLLENMESGSGVGAKGSNWNKAEGMLNKVIFSMIKQTYLPLFIQKLVNPQVDTDEKMKFIKEYHQVVQKCWEIVNSLKGVFELQALQEFLELAFVPEVLEIYVSLKSIKVIDDEVMSFHVNLASDIFEAGNQYWLVLRSTFNHLMFIFSQRPHLLSTGFKDLLVDLSLCREIRSLDSDIHLYRLETLLPNVVPKKYERLSMENISYQGAYVRCLTLMIVEGMISNVLTQINCCSIDETYQSQPIQQSLNALEGCIVKLLEVNHEVEKLSQSEMPYSQQHRQKLRTWQSLIVFLSLLDPQIYTVEFRSHRKQICGFDIIETINGHLWHSIKQSHIPSVRQYIEVFTVKFSLAFPNDTIGQPFFIGTLLNPNVKAQISSSFIMIAGYCMMHTQTLDDSQTTHFKKSIFEALIGFCTSNSAHTRCMAQYFVREMYRNDSLFRPFIAQGCELIFSFLDRCKNSTKILDKYGKEVVIFNKLIESNGVEALLAIEIDCYGEWIHKPFADILREITSEIITQIRNDNHYLGERDDYWRKLLNERIEKGQLNVQMAGVVRGNNSTDQINDGSKEVEPRIVEAQAQNYQRKMLPWDQLELEKTQLKKAVEKRKRNEVIICASLIDKVPNLAGLTRTCEIMNAKALVINSKEMVKTDEFAQIAVTAQKWQPIHEVQVTHLLEYLVYQKSNGYKILGLEQTANSKMLNEYEFPEKTLLLLGKEKEGIPQEFLGVLDECIEIPQFGVIRSLNVHVSGALCLWEYTKQMQKN